jgi:hemoglobin
MRVALIAALLFACAAKQPPPAPSAPASLYDRLGGTAAITAVVDDFIGNVAADERIARYFKDTNIPHLKSALVDQLCQATGGPCIYKGKSMKEVHRGLDISGRAFDAMVEDLVKTLNKFKLGEREKSELLAALGPLKPDVIERP